MRPSAGSSVAHVTVAALVVMPETTSESMTGGVVSTWLAAGRRTAKLAKMNRIPTRHSMVFMVPFLFAGDADQNGDARRHSRDQREFMGAAELLLKRSDTLRLLIFELNQSILRLLLGRDSLLEFGHAL